METIQVVIDSKLLRSANAAARRSKQNRSALIREALREHLHRMKIREMEERDRRAYERIPDSAEEWAAWEAEAVWPEE
jgi:metal-responsive CopG/Arc/MetJ family transcriptional regulator